MTYDRAAYHFCKFSMKNRYVVTAAFLIASYSVMPTAAHAADAEKGKTLFAQRCASCHGDKGAGDGPVGMALPPEMKPRNLQEGVFKVATDDEKMKNLIHTGGAANGLNPLMPAQADLADADLADLVAFIRTLKK